MLLLHKQNLDQIKMAKKRGRYDFDEATKDSAKRKWHADNPGNEKVPLEVDHHIPVWWAKKNNIPPDLVRTRQNARAMRVHEHKERHRNEPTDEEYTTLAQSVLGWIRNLI